MIENQQDPVKPTSLINRHNLVYQDGYRKLTLPRLEPDDEKAPQSPHRQSPTQTQKVRSSTVLPTSLPARDSIRISLR